MKIKAKKKDDERVVAVEYDVPDTLAELTARFGEAAVASAAKDSIVIGVQALMRRYWSKTDAEIQAAVSAHQPGVRTAAVKQTAAEKASSAISQMTPQERADLLTKLKAMQKQAA